MSIKINIPLNPEAKWNNRASNTKLRDKLEI